MQSQRRRWFVVILLLLLLAVVLALVRCRRTASPATTAAAVPAAASPMAAPTTGSVPTASSRPPEVLTPAELEAPAAAVLGTTVAVTWQGPNNAGDYITVVPQGAPDSQHANYVDVAKGSPAPLQLPVVPGEAELRYIAAQSGKVLGRRAIRILPAEVSLDAPAQVTAGAEFKVMWTGPNNAGDYITIVPADAADGQHANYGDTARGSQVAITAPIAAGDAELRYMTGSGSRVLGRRAIRVVSADVTLSAADEVVAGSRVTVQWSGPNNRGDYITIVPKTARDGQSARYADTARGSPARVEAPIDPGVAEIRYMSGQGARVLARRDLLLVAPKVILHPPSAAAVGETIAVEWTGPDNPGDYLTIVPASAKDGMTLQMAPSARGTPAKLRVPTDAGPAEVRYLSGQGNRVLARARVDITPK